MDDDDAFRTVHLFVGNRLVANLRMSTWEPEPFYEVDGVLYQVVSQVGPVISSNDGLAWDLQVEATRAETRATALP